MLPQHLLQVRQHFSDCRKVRFSRTRQETLSEIYCEYEKDGKDWTRT